MLNGTSYMIKNTFGKKCTLGIADGGGISGIPFMIFGDTFMRNYFVGYDKPNN